MNHNRDLRRPTEVLLVEDNPADSRLIEEILLLGPIPKNVRVVADGDQALDCLRRRGAFVKARRPALIVLDLNLPGRDGRGVLEEVKSDPDLRKIPVIVLTTSAAPTDVQHAYDLHANAYIVKPVGLDAFTQVIRAVEEFWLAAAQLPT